MQAEYVSEGIIRWAHVVAGILWIGLLYFFNWVNSAFAPTLDAETKRKVLPELLPRTLYWFRWGAAWTWVTGILLLILVYYRGADLYADGRPATHMLIPAALVGLTVLVYAYDMLYKTVLKAPAAGFWGGLVLSSAVIWVLREVADFSFRGYFIHLGAMFGSMMAFNVWYRIWPAQKKIITAIKNGDAPDGDLVKLAGGRSKHNTYMSVPLVFAMLGQHMTWAASSFLYVPVIIFVGWSIVWMLYKRAAKVPGF